MECWKRGQEQQRLPESVVVFDLGRKIDAENELRDIADEEFKKGAWLGPISNGTFQVTVAKQDQVFADIETLDAFVKQGVISPEVRNQIVKTQERPLRISITSMPGQHMS